MELVLLREVEVLDFEKMLARKWCSEVVNLEGDFRYRAKGVFLHV